MITYELAKKLKDAGFPQEGYTIQCFYRNPETNEIGGGCYAVPTLSELIEACVSLSYYFELSRKSETFGGEWVAKTDDGNPNMYQTKYIVVEGGTPEEAVAYLYLALKGKSGVINHTMSPMDGSQITT